MKTTILTPRLLTLLSLFTVTFFLTNSATLAFDAAKERVTAQKHIRNGNHKDAYTLYSKLLDQVSDRDTGRDLSNALQCLRNTNRQSETDALLERNIARHSKNFHLIHSAANAYRNTPHYGYLIAGEFHRGSHRGGGKYVDATERDRARSLQLFLKAEALINDKLDLGKGVHSGFYQNFASALQMNHFGHLSWKLQKLTPLNELPDYASSRGGRWSRSASAAPVTPNGKPLYYSVPDSWANAANDGERWRWLNDQAAKLQNQRSGSFRYAYAQFLRSQFGVNTMASYTWFGRLAQGNEENNKGILQLHTLKDNETVAKLANGVKRFAFPDEHNFIGIYQNLFKDKGLPYSVNAGEQLVSIYQDRRQYVKAAEVLRELIQRRKHKRYREQLDDIVGNWANFDTTANSFPAGKQPQLGFVFRNAETVTLEVQPVDLKKLQSDLIKHLKSNPRKLDWNQLHWRSLGNQLINGDHKKYLLETAAETTIALKPRKNHWDTRQTLTVPVKNAGAHLVTATLKGGRKVHTVVWLDNLTIVHKAVKGGILYTVTDAISGAPANEASLSFFGYRQNPLKNPNILRKFNVKTLTRELKADKNGQVLLQNLDRNYQWMLIATSGEKRTSIGFHDSNRWYNNHGHYNQTKAFGITDRPVYRPGQKVYGKFWVREAKYTKDDTSRYAGQRFQIIINTPRGERLGKEITGISDEWGGVSYEVELPEDCQLGHYRVQVRTGRNWRGQHHFRVEKYKKPEFEVLVESPKTPVKLGDTFEATVKANYYHGSPVTNAEVKVKVLRTKHNTRWFPIGPWDWLYGSGYGWMDIERPWYPGWKSWGCRCPIPIWWPRNWEQPEVVLEQTARIGKDGTFKVKIDSSIAKEIHGNDDHSYQITAEVVDASRRTIVGSGTTLAARKPFNVTVWLSHGHMQAGAPFLANFTARTLDGKTVASKGKATLYRVTADARGKVKESKVNSWDVEVPDHGDANLKLEAGKAGQYRLEVALTDAKKRTIKGAILFTVRGEPAGSEKFVYDHLELILDKRTYKPGETAKLLINTKRPNSHVVLFTRGGESYRLIKVRGQSTTVDIPITLKDMPNHFISAFTVSDAQVHTQTKELIVPPEKRVLNISVLPNSKKYKPRDKGTLKIKVTDINGKPVKGDVALTIYDKALEYISGGSNVGNIKEFFWKWRRHYYKNIQHSANHWENNVLKRDTRGMRFLGVFGRRLADDDFGDGWGEGAGVNAVPTGGFRDSQKAAKGTAMPSAPKATAEMKPGENRANSGVNPGQPQPMIRKDFADLVKWQGSIKTNKDGIAEVPVKFPDNLTTWKIKLWAVAHGTKVGEASTEVITSKDLIIRLQAPRFFIEKDEVTLSAVVHNYHKKAQSANISIELEGGTLKLLSPQSVQTELGANNGEVRIDWRTKVTQSGKAIVRMKVVTTDDADAMELTFPVYVHGIFKQEAWSRAILPSQSSTTIDFNIPAERIPEHTKLEVRYSPSIASSIISALPYLADYPHGCTEQTLNRFVPTVICQKLLKDMDINLEAVRNQRNNLNPQELGDDQERIAQWKRWQLNPVFSEKEVAKMTAKGVTRLGQMQLSNGGWGWFSGYGERAYPHTTAVVLHGLITAKENGAKVPADMINRGVTWLRNYEAKETERIRMWKKRERDTKQHASAIDAFCRLVLAEHGLANKEMLSYLFRDKNQLPVYAKALTGMALHYDKQPENRDAIIKNIEQFLVFDDENQTAYLNLGNNGYWWSWYGSEFEAHAWYLKLLAATKPDSKQARGLVKYLVNNRKHATYWNSTRDTAYCIEAIADYLKASKETISDTTVEVIVDGKPLKKVTITKKELFSFDNKFTIAGDALTSGAHKVEIKKTGEGPLYVNAYLMNFTKEDFITKAGLEVKVNRAYYKLERIKDAQQTSVGAHGQIAEHKVEKYKRVPLKSGDTVQSGDLIEVELTIESKNDYEYLMFSDWKPAGCENKDVRSGYTNNGMRAYMEAHDEKTLFFVRRLARGKHSLSYQLRAEIPGKFSALPAQADAMYAPELKANSDELKINIKDAPAK